MVGCFRARGIPRQRGPNRPDGKRSAVKRQTDRGCRRSNAFPGVAALSEHCNELWPQTTTGGRANGSHKAMETGCALDHSRAEGTHVGLASCLARAGSPTCPCRCRDILSGTVPGPRVRATWRRSPTGPAWPQMRPRCRCGETAHLLPRGRGRKDGRRCFPVLRRRSFRPENTRIRH